MKKLIIILAALFLVFTSCDTTDPKPPDEKPPGYQEDIPWPSLADSPWPRYHGNAQNNGRTSFHGPQAGIIEKTIEIDIEDGSIYAGIVVGADSCIYFATNNGYLYSMTKAGELNWKIRLTDKEIQSTPLIGADGTIYIGLSQEKKYIAVNSDGTIKWKYNTEREIYDLTTNIGLDGTLYFPDATSHLNALNQEGVLLWRLYAPQFLSGAKELTFSPDGKILYICSRFPAITAIDISNRQILWEFDGYFTSSVVADVNGNIYFIANEEDGHYGIPSYMNCVTSDGEIKWKYEFSNWTYYGYQDPAIDKDGNIYFAGDTLYSLDYSGKLRWKKGFGNKYIRHPIICDGMGNLYSVLRDLIDGHFEILAFNNSGDIIWQIPRYDSDQGLFEASGAIGYDNYLYVALDDYPSILYLVK